MAEKYVIKSAVYHYWSPSEDLDDTYHYNGVKWSRDPYTRAQEEEFLRLEALDVMGPHTD